MIKSFNTSNSFMGRMNPTLKVGCLAFLIVLTFLPAGFIPLLLVLLLVITMYATSRISIRKLKPVFRLMLFVFALTFLINWLVVKTPGFKADLTHTRGLIGWNWDTLLRWGWVKEINGTYWASTNIWGGWVAPALTDIKPDGSFITTMIAGKAWYLGYSAPWYALSPQVLITTITICTRITIMLLIFSLLVNTSTTLQLTSAFENIFKPLKIFKAPVTEIAVIMAVAIKFVPNLLKEANNLIASQASRGQDLRNGKLITKVKALVALIIPMFSIAFNQADQLSDALEARSFNPSAKRTKYKVYKVQIYDWLFFASLLVLIALFSCLVHWKVIITPTFWIDCFM